jgi:hypothetical protein
VPQPLLAGTGVFARNESLTFEQINAFTDFIQRFGTRVN